MQNDKLVSPKRGRSFYNWSLFVVTGDTNTNQASEYMRYNVYPVFRARNTFLFPIHTRTDVYIYILIGKMSI